MANRMERGLPSVTGSAFSMSMDSSTKRSPILDFSASLLGWNKEEGNPHT